jgi:hypothetical protein
MTSVPVVHEAQSCERLRWLGLQHLNNGRLVGHQTGRETRIKRSVLSRSVQIHLQHGFVQLEFGYRNATPFFKSCFSANLPTSMLSALLPYCVDTTGYALRISGAAHVRKLPKIRTVVERFFFLSFHAVVNHLALPAPNAHFYDWHGMPETSRNSAKLSLTHAYEDVSVGHTRLHCLPAAS